jgi:hypothetical protein
LLLSFEPHLERFVTLILLARNRNKSGAAGDAWHSVAAEKLALWAWNSSRAKALCRCSGDAMQSPESGDWVTLINRLLVFQVAG